MVPEGECRLGDVIELLTDYHANGSYEKLKESVSMSDETLYAVMIRTTNFEKNNFNDNLKYINELSYQFLRKSKVYANDLIMNKIANAGACYFMPKLSRPVSLGMNLFLIRIDVKKANPYFVYAFLKKNEFYVKSFSSGSATKTITKKDVRKLKIYCPPLLEQNKIAKVLTTWDKAITTTEKLLANSQQQKKALMQQLLTGKKRRSGFSGVWEKTELGKLLDYKQPTPFLVKSTEYDDEYITPVLTAGKTFILGYSNENFGIFQDDLPAIIFDDFTTASKYVDFPFKAKSSAMKILTAKEGVSIKFVFEAMQILNYAVGGHQRHWISIYSNIVINLPNYEEQQKIDSVISVADKEITALQNKLGCLKQEKKALMQQLLTGKRRVKVDA